MRIFAINGSPKGEKSSSREIISILRTKLPAETALSVLSQIAQYRKPDDSVFPVMAESEVLVITSPLFVDGLPASLMVFLERYQRFLQSPEGTAGRAARQRVFAIVNCGFYEGAHNEFALRMLSHWCEASSLSWRGGAGIGTGEMIHGLSKVPEQASIRKPVIQAIEAVAKAISSGPEGRLEPAIFTQHAFPWLLFKLAGEAGWRSQAKANGVRPRDLRARPLERADPRP